MASEIKNNNEGETLEREDSNSTTNLKPTSQAPKTTKRKALIQANINWGNNKITTKEYNSIIKQYNKINQNQGRKT